jgi:hypothetical protein
MVATLAASSSYEATLVTIPLAATRATKRIW